MTRYAVVWPDGLHDRARFASGPVHCFWLQFWLGLQTYWPGFGMQARRVYTFRPASGDPFIELDAPTIAYVLEQQI